MYVCALYILLNFQQSQALHNTVVPSGIMAQGRSNRVCKWLRCILLLLCFGFVTCEEYFIVPSQSHPCCADHCLTLSQFVSTFTNYSKYDNTTLIFAPGNYNLEYNFVIEDVLSFSMYAEASTSEIRITCNADTRFEFRNVNSVTVRGLHFVESSGNLVASVGQIHLTFSSDPEVSGTTLIIVGSTAYLDNISFLSTIENTAQYRESVTVQSQENCTSDSAGTYRIVTNNSVIIVAHSLFDGSMIGVGAIIHSLDSSEITISSSVFQTHRAKCCYSNDTSSRCTGAILRVYNSAMNVYNSRFQYNQGNVVQVDGGVTSLSHCVFSNHFRRHTNFCVEGVIFFMCDGILSISSSTFVNNTATILEAFRSNVIVKSSNFIGNSQVIELEGGHASIDHNTFAKNNGQLLNASNFTTVRLSHNEFVDNTNEFNLVYLASNKQGSAEDGRHTSIAYNTFTSNSVGRSNEGRLISLDVNTINLDHNKFVGNAGFSLIYLIADEVTVRLNEFISNKMYDTIVWLPYYTKPEKFSIINNVLMDNDAVFDVYVNSNCKPGLSLSLGTSHCVKCPEHWYLSSFGLVIAAFIAGIVLVVLMLALNITVAVGTLNGILLYANIVEANIDGFFSQTSAPNFATVVISWLNLDIGLISVSLKE